jgi:hypothetical protein
MLVGAMLLSIAIGSSAKAATVTLYSSDFTTGYTENAQLNGVDGWFAQTGLVTINVGSNGQVQHANLGTNGFLRALNASTAFAVGETIDISASVKMNNLNSVGFDANILSLGITHEPDASIGSLATRAGVMLGAQGTNYRLAATAPTGTKINAGARDTGYHDLLTSITKLATPGEFSVTGSYNGVALATTTITNLDLYNAASVRTMFQTQGQSNVGGVVIDSLNVNLVTAVPEPTSMAFLGLGGVGMLVRRRRR